MHVFVEYNVMRTERASVFIVSFLLVCNNVLHTWWHLFGSLNHESLKIIELV